MCDDEAEALHHCIEEHSKQVSLLHRHIKLYIFIERTVMKIKSLSYDPVHEKYKTLA